MAGKFISLEGGEGTGKSTQLKLLAKSIERVGMRVIETREPGGTEQAERIRSILVTGNSSKLNPFTELLLHNAARKEHVENVIKPGLAEGKIVISDRFADSTVAYQAYGHELGTAIVKSITQLTIGNFTPDLTIILDIKPEEGLKRAGSRAGSETRYEQMEKAFHERVREGFLAIAKQEPERCVVISSDKSVEAVHKSIISVVNSHLSLNLKISDF